MRYGGAGIQTGNAVKVRKILEWLADALLAVVVGSEVEFHRRRFDRVKLEAARDKEDDAARKRWAGGE